MAKWDEASVAAELLACEAERRDREPFTDEWPELDVDTGYRIQDAIWPSGWRGEKSWWA